MIKLSDALMIGAGLVVIYYVAAPIVQYLR